MRRAATSGAAGNGTRAAGQMAGAGPRQFTGEIVARGPGGAWAHLVVPFDVAEAFGTRARVAVAGTMNGSPFRTSLMPNGDGTHYMVVNKALRAAANARAGDPVSVVMGVDTSPRTVAVPDDLRAAVAANPAAAAAFGRLAHSHRKAYVDWIGEAKRPATRARRVARAVELLVADGRPGG